MKKIIAIFLVIIGSTSVMAQDVNPSKLEYKNMQLELANAKLRLKVDSLEDVVTELKAKLIVFSSFQDMLDSLENTIEPLSVSVDDGKTSEAEARSYVDDYYSFYRTDYAFKNLQLRRKGDNQWLISLSEAPKSMVDNKFAWHSQLVLLSVNDDGTYEWEPQ
jgi:hypothetical protein